MPLSGSFFGFPASAAGMRVSVEITLEDQRTDLPLHSAAAGADRRA